MMSSDNLKAYVKNWWIDDEPEAGVDFLSTRTSFFNMKHRTNFHFLSNDPTDNIVVYMCRDFTGNSWPTWLIDHLYGEAFWALTRQNPGTATDTGEANIKAILNEYAPTVDTDSGKSYWTEGREFKRVSHTSKCDYPDV